MRNSRYVVFSLVLLTCSGVLQRWVRTSRAAESLVYTDLSAPLADLPVRIGPWVMEQDLPLEPDALRAARVDTFLHRRYVDPTTRKQLVLYVGYWGRENRGLGHGPEVCYPAVGWTAEGEPVSRTIPIGIPGAGNDANVTLHRFRRSDAGGIERQAVAFSAAISGRFEGSSRGTFWHRPGRFHGSGGHYLAHIQVSTRVDGDSWTQSGDDVLSFMKSILPALERILPRQRGGQRSGAWVDAT